MSSPASRVVLRQPRVSLRRAIFRNASTTAEATKTVKEKSSQAASKAAEGLSRVTSSAGSAISKVGLAAGSAIGRVGGRTGRLLGSVQALIPQTIYYSKVGLELGKIIFEHRKMSPPSMATFQTYFQPLLNGLRNPSNLFASASSASNALSPPTLLNRVRNLNSQQLASAGIVAAEVLGFFTVGEIIGRFKLVGYRGGDHAEHH